MGAYSGPLNTRRGGLNFGKPIAAFPEDQSCLARCLHLTACTVPGLRLAKLDDEGTLATVHCALAKAFCTAKSRETVSGGREVLGGKRQSSPTTCRPLFSLRRCRALYSYEVTFRCRIEAAAKAITGPAPSVMLSEPGVFPDAC